MERKEKGNLSVKQAEPTKAFKAQVPTQVHEQVPPIYDNSDHLKPEISLPLNATLLERSPSPLLETPRSASSTPSLPLEQQGTTRRTEILPRLVNVAHHQMLRQTLPPSFAPRLHEPAPNRHSSFCFGSPSFPPTTPSTPPRIISACSSLISLCPSRSEAGDPSNVHLPPLTQILTRPVSPTGSLSFLATACQALSTSSELAPSALPSHSLPALMSLSHLTSHRLSQI